MKAGRRSFLQKSIAATAGFVLSPFAFGREELLPFREFERSAYTMGSIVTIRAFAEDGQTFHRAVEEAFRELKAIDRIMSAFDRDSDVCRVNAAPEGTVVAVDPRLTEIIRHADDFAQRAGGGFNITIEPLMKLYGFHGAPAKHLPTDRQLREVLDAVGIGMIESDLRASTLTRRHRNSQIDLGGIAVGYALDRCANILASHGIGAALINHSGDIIAIGSPPGEEGWNIGIVDPLHPDSIITSVMIADQALATSGNYEDFVRLDEATIGHILSPSTGKPAEKMLSSTVIARTAIEADALSTGLFVDGTGSARGILGRFAKTKFLAIMEGEGRQQFVEIE